MAPRKPKADEPTETFNVIDNLRFNGEDYVAGEPVDMTEDQAAPLLDTVVQRKAAAPAA